MRSANSSSMSLTRVAAAVRTLTGVAVNPADVREVVPVSWSDAVVTPEVQAAVRTAAASRGIRLIGAVAAGTGLASVIPHARALAAERASWMNRLWKTVSSLRCPCMTFSATRRSSRRSVATYTVAMPPRAMRARTRYRPSTRRPISGSAC